MVGLEGGIVLFWFWSSFGLLFLIYFFEIVFVKMGCGISKVIGFVEVENNFDFSWRNIIVNKFDVVVEIGKGVKKID